MMNSAIAPHVRQTVDIDYGSLTGLIGTWTGTGFNMVALPNQQDGFGLLVQKYNETLIIDAVGATTPDRGLTEIVNIPTLQYRTTINDFETGLLLHVEAGFWETIPAAANGGFDIFRLATIPHGDALTAMGNATVLAGPPVIDIDLSGLPTGNLPTTDGYTDMYGFPYHYPDFAPGSPALTLANILKQQEAAGDTITATTVLDVKTSNAGGINNIAMVSANTPTTEFDATWYVETVQPASGAPFLQLQYVQRTLMSFPVSGDTGSETIVWPHIQVNTLTLAG